MTPPPAGYQRLELAGTEIVAMQPMLDTIRELLDDDAHASTIYGWASQHPSRRPLSGRGIAYAVPLPDRAATPVVVRRSRHGGLFARLTSDRFLPPTRAPHELEASERLLAGGVLTPRIVATLVYRAGPLLRRSDVVTREVTRSHDLAALLLATDAPDERRPMLEATARLLASLRAAGVRHPDLNVKNVLLASGADHALDAYVLDVDRVHFERADSGAAMRANIDRLTRSARKWRQLYGAHITDEELAWLTAQARH